MAAKKKSTAKAKPKAKKKLKSLLPVPASKEAALAWFANLASRVSSANAEELKKLVAEARTYDLVGLGEVLNDDQQVLDLNSAANQLIEATLESFGSMSPEAFQLQVLRDILNDS